MVIGEKTGISPLKNDQIISGDQSMSGKNIERLSGENLPVYCFFFSKIPDYKPVFFYQDI